MNVITLSMLPYVAAIIILIILVVQTSDLYKEKWNSPIMLMLISSIITTVAEVLWSFAEYYGWNPIYVYLFAAFGVSFSILFIGELTIYVLNGLGYKIKVPLAQSISIALTLIIFILYISSVNTNWLLTVDSSSKSHTGYFSYYFYFLIYLCYVVLLIIALFKIHSLRKNSNSENYKNAVTVIFFVIMLFSITVLQHTAFKGEYYNTPIVVSLSLLFLISSMSTRIFINSEKNRLLIEKDLDTAHNIQMNALKMDFPPFKHHPDIDLYAEMHPSKDVGGDFFDCFEIGNNHVCFVVADVSGKGIPASLFMMISKTLIRDHAFSNPHPDEICSKVNDYLCQNNDENMFTTAWVGILDTETGVLEYTNAGHCFPFFSHNGQDFIKLNQTHGFMLGVFDFATYTKESLHFDKGDTLFLYSDGLTDARNTNDNIWGDSSFVSYLNASKSYDGRTILHDLMDMVNTFSNGVPQFDDITMMVVKYYSGSN